MRECPGTCSISPMLRWQGLLPPAMCSIMHELGGGSKSLRDRMSWLKQLAVRALAEREWIRRVCAPELLSCSLIPTLLPIWRDVVPKP